MDPRPWQDLGYPSVVWYLSQSSWLWLGVLKWQTVFTCSSVSHNPKIYWARGTGRPFSMSRETRYHLARWDAHIPTIFATMIFESPNFLLTMHVEARVMIALFSPSCILQSFLSLNIMEIAGGYRHYILHRWRLSSLPLWLHAAWCFYAHHNVLIGFYCLISGT